MTLDSTAPPTTSTAGLRLIYFSAQAKTKSSFGLCTRVEQIPFHRRSSNGLRKVIQQHFEFGQLFFGKSSSHNLAMRAPAIVCHLFFLVVSRQIFLSFYHIIIIVARKSSKGLSSHGSLLSNVCRYRLTVLSLNNIKRRGHITYRRSC